MAVELYQFSATIPANTPKSAPSVTDIDLDGWEITQIDLKVPPGPSYLMGFYLARSGQQWIPQGAGEYIVWDDHYQQYPLSSQPTGGGWQVVGYNLDTQFDHTVAVTFHVNPLTIVAPAGPTLTIVSQPTYTTGVLL